MAKRRKPKREIRAEPQGSFLCTNLGFESLCFDGYVKLSDNPEIQAGVNKIADLVSCMTIHLKENTDNGDIRIQDELAKKIDINPNSIMTRKTFISNIVRSLLLEGDGNAYVLPMTNGGYLEGLYPLDPAQVSLMSKGYFDYAANISGVLYDPSEILHIVINPNLQIPWKGTGYRTTLRDVAKTLKQANETKKGFMESKWNPSLIVRVDSNSEELSSKEGRANLARQHFEVSEKGEPWFLPSELMEVQQVKPLSLNDIALPESVRLDKRTVAAVLDIPPFLVGEGEFKEAEWNNFIKTRIRGICNAIEQELTKKLLISTKRYFRFNLRSLYAYDLQTLSSVGCDLYTRGMMSGNEVRNWMELSPKAGLDELIILENYIPQGMIGEQSKLNGGEDK